MPEEIDGGFTFTSPYHARIQAMQESKGNVVK